MAVTLTNAEVRSSLRYVYTNDADIQSAVQQLSTSGERITISGNAAFSDSRTLGATATEELDLAGGLVDVFGRTLTFTTITSLFVQNTGTGTAGPLVIGGATASAWVGPFGGTAHTVTVARGYPQAFPSPGWPVTSGSADLLRISTPGQGTSYNIIITGVVA